MNCIKTNFFQTPTRIVILFIFLFLSSYEITAQVIEEKPVEQKPPNENEIYSLVEVRPDFPGGMQKFYEFIGQNYIVPNVKDLKGKIFVQFVIEKDGSLSDAKVLRDIGYGTGIEALRVLALSPKWTAGEQDGKKVRVLYSLPISIQGR